MCHDPKVRSATRLLSPLILMAVIFTLSAQPGLGTGLGTWDLVLRKLAHMTEYGVLWWLWWRVTPTRSPWPAVLITSLYAISDEVHQTYVRDRHGTPVDVAIDMVGVTIAILVTRRFLSARAAGPIPTSPETDRS